MDLAIAIAMAESRSPEDSQSSTSVSMAASSAAIDRGCEGVVGGEADLGRLAVGADVRDDRQVGTPLGHQVLGVGGSLLLGHLGRVALLRVDDHVGAGSVGEAGRHALGVRPRDIAQDAGRVVDVLVDDRLGERRPRAQGGRGQDGRQHDRRDGGQAQGGAAAGGSTHVSRIDGSASGPVRSRVTPDEDVRDGWAAVVARALRGGIGAGIGDGHQVAAAEGRQVVRAEGVGGFADGALDAGRGGIACG